MTTKAEINTQLSKRTNKEGVFVLAVLAMAGVLALSNYLVGLRINDWLTWASLTYPLVFLVTDISNRAFGVRAAAKVVAWGFCCGVLFSFISASPRIALASGSAFLIAGAINILVFDRLRQTKRWWLPPAVSSCFASISDTFIFFGLAFFATGVPWVSLGAGDLGVKLFMIIFFLPLYRLAIGLIQTRAGSVT